MSAHSSIPAQLTRLTDLDDARAVATPGARLEAMRAAARSVRDRIASTGVAVSVRTFSLATFPYPAGFGFNGAALSPAPFVMLRNRMQLVQVEANEQLVNILVNPTDPMRSIEAPFFARQIARYGDFLARRVMATVNGSPAKGLATLGIAPEDIDYITFDHLHVQDVRGLLGTIAPEPGFHSPTDPLLPNAKLLVQKEELRIFEALHPMQDYWYVRDCIRGVDPQKIVVLDGDYTLGAGFAIIKTPGHTEGNHSLVVNTDRGLWTISENGVAVESYAPECSEIPGLRRHARDAGVEVVLNGNTRENSLDQYISMVVEKTIADPCPQRPEFPQHFPSSEIVKSRLAPGLSPTFTYGSLTHGELRTSRCREEPVAVSG